MEFFLRKEQKTNDTPRRLTGWQRLKESALIIALLFAVFISISLLSYDTSDPSWSQTAWDGPVKNAAGEKGAMLADTLFFIFGVLAYCVPFLVGVLGWIFFIRRDENNEFNYADLATRLLGSVLLLLSSCTLADLNFDDFDFFSSGGVIGDVLTEMILPMFGGLGSTLMMLCLWAAGFTLFTGISWLTIVDRLGEGLLNSFTAVLNKIRGDQSRTFDHEQHLYHEDVTLDPHLHAEPPKKPLYQQDDDPLLNKPIAPSLTRDLNGFDLYPHHGKSSRIEADPLMGDTESDVSQSMIQRQPSSSVTHPFHAVEEQNKQSSQVKEQPLSSRTEPFMESSSHLPIPPLMSELNQLHTNEDDFEDPLFMKTPAEKARDEQLAAERARRVSELDAQEDWPSINTQELGQGELPKPEDLDFDYLGNKEREISIGNLDGLSELERAERLTDLPEIEDDPFQQTIRDAQQKAAGQTHPFLVRNEPNLPKPSEPLPTLELLDLPKSSGMEITDEELQYQARLIETRLEEYKISVKVKSISPGPVITRFELELAPGVKVSRIMSLSKDIARSLSTTSVRVVDVIPGKPFVGLELPNTYRETVYMSEVIDSERFQGSSSPLSVVLGKDIAGEAIVTDLAKAPHMLVAGTTGSGKSVGVNVMIVSMLYKATPDDVRFIMIDPKMLELSVYEGIPHLLSEVVTDMKDASNALRWCVAEMERRYKLMSKLGVRNISGYNERIKEASEANMPIPDPFWNEGDSMDLNAPMLEKLPYIVVIVDEFADLIMVVGKKVEELIARLAQKARAAGIHLVLATQRPSVDVITGLIKANIPTRMAFTVSTKTDSRTILDQSGAESLLGMGDMLFMPNGSNHPIRVHGAFVNDDEVHRVVNNWKARGKPQYISEITHGDQGADGLLPGESSANSVEELDQLFDQVVEFVCDTRRASISGIQRRFKVGYNRAARIVDQLEAQGIISPPGMNSNREVLAPPPARD